MAMIIPFIMLWFFAALMVHDFNELQDEYRERIRKEIEEENRQK